MRIRKSRIRFGKKGLGISPPSIRIGGKRSGYNISKSGVSYSTKIGKGTLNSKRGCSMPIGIFLVLLIASSLFGPSALAAPTAPTPTTLNTPAQTQHVFYASAKAKKYYYCDDDPQWKDLSPKYLLKFNTEAEAKAKTNMVLHRPCQN